MVMMVMGMAHMGTRLSLCNSHWARQGGEIVGEGFEILEGLCEKDTRWPRAEQNRVEGGYLKNSELL